MKILLRIAIAAVVVTGFALAALLVFVDPNAYRPQIEQQVEQATGRQLSIDGSIGLSLWPLGLELGNVELANAPGFDDPYFARIDSLVIRVRLLPLLKQELAVDALALDGLSLLLQVKPDGRSNWQDLLAPAGTGAAQADQSAASQDSAPPLAALAVNGVSIRNAQLQFNDQASGQLLQLSRLNLGTGAIRFGQPFDVQLDFNLGHRQGGQQNAADIRLSSAVTLDQSLQQLALNGLELDIRAKLPALQAEPVRLGVRADSSIDLAGQHIAVRDAVIDTMFATLNLQAEVTNWQTGLHISGRLQSAEVAPRDVLQQLAVELPAMQSPTALSKASLGMQFELQDNRLRLQPLELVLDDSRLQGELSINLASSAIRYRLQLDRMDVDAYLPPPPAGEQQPELKQAASAEAAEQDLPVPFEALAALDVQGEFGIAELRLAGIVISQLNTRTRLRDGVITLSPLSLQVLQGTVQGDTVIDTRGRQLAIRQTLKADKLEIAEIANPVVAALIPEQTIDLRGAGRLYAELRSRGLRLGALQQALNGKAGFAFDAIQANGLDADFLLRGVIADYLESKKLNVKPGWRGSYRPENVTAFDTVKADFVVRNGVARTDNLAMKARRIAVTAKGSIDIPAQTLDMQTVTDLSPRQRKTLAEKLLDEPLPVRVYGPWAAPQVDVDTGPIKAAAARLAKDRAREEIKQKVDTKKQQLRDKARDRLKDKFKNLLRR